MNSYWRYIKQYGWVTLISSLLLMALVVMSQTLQNASSFADSYSTLLFFTIGGVTLLLVLLFRTVFKLYTQFRKKVPGSKVTVRLTVIASLVLGIPTAIIFYFSLTFIQQGINQWFDVKTEVALDNATSLVRITLDNKTRDSLKLTLSISKANKALLTESPSLAVNMIRQQLNAQEVALYNINQQLVAFSSEYATAILPEAPGANLFQQIRNGKTYAALESRAGATLQENFIRVVIPFSDSQLSNQFALQVIFPVPADITLLSDSVATASGQYKELSYLKGPLTASFVLILSMVLLLTLVTAVLFTITAVQNFTRPIRTLAKGTRAVSKGDYTVKMPVPENDEFGDLIQSFNDMIQRIAQARNEIKLGHQQTEVQKLYLQAVIKNLSSGVVTLDMHYRIRTINDAVQEILNTDLKRHIGKKIADITDREDTAHLMDLVNKIAPKFEKSSKPWSTQIDFACKKGQKILLIHGSTLPSIDQKIGGYVIVIDDITELVQAQLHAAWSDVARRLAHEIKNPLTPIQLSAERLKYKLFRKLDETDQALLTRMTETITEQVSTMQKLVQAFSDYANTPEVELVPTKINTLISNITEMYRDPDAAWKVFAELQEPCPKTLVDSSRLRQLLHNLIKNAIEATENTILPRIIVKTYSDDPDWLTLSICDNGPGIPEEAQNWIFEPYATDKPKGTGLGLAVVRKIVEEHHGKINLTSSPNNGTCFIIKLPTISSENE
ncbi:two-component sensor histidine kinase [Thiomicrorhabdus immobilis]|uniref:histidine kinase n=1 Tax=Thiomicrorhabdus immobilis TaxID=2791037 RepID=A0ABN6CU21_9GAMM|nr:ATP-binding protein [Thiomicrorhabdus immobilis]BCN92450.1 two-component sensor histidine kinase [Thiomicrorhabdus immobilis]